MRGGKNKKTIEEHIANGTYRPSLHGYLNISDEQSLQEMKNELYTSFKLLTIEIKKLDVTKPEELSRYEKLNELRGNYIKIFHSIAKTPVEDKQETRADNPYGFKTH